MIGNQLLGGTHIGLLVFNLIDLLTRDLGLTYNDLIFKLGDLGSRFARLPLYTNCLILAAQVIRECLARVRLSLREPGLLTWSFTG